jgi:hypothetical protein
VPDRDADSFLSDITLNSVKTCKLHYDTFVADNDDMILNDGRGGKHEAVFYDIFPDIEQDARNFAYMQCTQKNASFKVDDLVDYVHERFIEQADILPEDCVRKVRSNTSCFNDLIKWNIRYDKNKSQPYFEGHERDDVVVYRKEFVGNLCDNIDRYYTLSEDIKPSWKAPKEGVQPIVLICHDESTFRSGEQFNSIWNVQGVTRFFNKGKGRSYMVSDFMVLHPSSPFFFLDENEWEAASSDFPKLSEDAEKPKYKEYTCTGSIAVGGDNYFDSNTIRCQFERLFMMLRYKKAYANHDFEILVDNARTHTAVKIDINKFK